MEKATTPLPQLGHHDVYAFAPASIGNVGPGFDVLGLALSAPGDLLGASLRNSPGLSLIVHGDGGRLPRELENNSASLAARLVLERASAASQGLTLELHKCMPFASGLGSSAASAVAAAVAVNQLLGKPLSDRCLVEICYQVEGMVSGPSADNAAASIYGGMVLLSSLQPLQLISLPVPDRLHVVVAHPCFELSTRQARAVLPPSVSLAERSANAARLGTLLSALYTGRLGRIADALQDPVVTPARAALVPGAVEVMRAARSAGALGSSISGAGPSVFAFCDGPEGLPVVGIAMRAAFATAGLNARLFSGPARAPGARLVSVSELASLKLEYYDKPC
ncbi:MAG: homoserine kinase [Myxococcota bacterium]|jgi:homoserine kinase|nr:homoserine kinase [Myxococcota bacterium]